MFAVFNCLLYPQINEDGGVSNKWEEAMLLIRLEPM